MASVSAAEDLRSGVEAFNNGLVPVVTGINMEDNFDAQTTLWKDGVTHVSVPLNANPEEIADIVRGALSMHKDDAKYIVSNGRKILKDHFGHMGFAQDMILLAKGKPAGVYPKLEHGTAPDGFYKTAKKFAKEKSK